MVQEPLEPASHETTEALEVARNHWGVVLWHPNWRTLELKWLPTTREMTDQGFKDTITVYAGEGERLSPRWMLIDATEFVHEFGPGTLDWREEHIIPRYNAAGVTKFAFIMPAGFPGSVEQSHTPGVEGAVAKFPTGWFEARGRAYEWLAGPES